MVVLVMVIIIIVIIIIVIVSISVLIIIIVIIVDSVNSVNIAGIRLFDKIALEETIMILWFSKINSIYHIAIH